jgi:glutathione synthase/RimK-type ligase-like ATP-grasp enzyme
VKIGLKIQDEIVDISNFCVVLYRHFDINTIIFHDQEIINTFSIQQWEDAYRILQSNLLCEWINSFDATSRVADRVLQLSAAEKIGFDIPATIVTNDPKEAHKFYFANNRNIIIKALRHHCLETSLP